MWKLQKHLSVFKKSVCDYSKLIYTRKQKATICQGQNKGKQGIYTPPTSTIFTNKNILNDTKNAFYPLLE